MPKFLNKEHSLSLTALIMIGVISVDSLKNLPIAAQYGYLLITFYILAGILFFFPLTYVASKLVIKYPETGGSYIWIKNAFGNKTGTLAIWLQWLYNMIWYPTLFAFITATIASFLQLSFGSSPQFIFFVSLVLFWMISLLHSFGIRFTRAISTTSAIFGTLLPMILIIGFGAYWLLSGNPSATTFNWQSFLPSKTDFNNIGFFTNILFSLLGLEVICMHAGNVKNPKKVYPIALTISAILILITITLSSISLCIIVPAKEIGLMSGLMDVLMRFFNTYNIQIAKYIIGLTIILGSIGIASSWMIGMARGLHASIQNTKLPAFFKKLNHNYMPTNLIFTQAIIYSFLLAIFLFVPNVNHSYWFLTDVSAQFALIYYILFFSAAIKLLKKDKLGVIFSSIAIVICCVGILAGMVPPTKL